MIPDFSQKTKDTLAKRAAYRCSSPECGKLTVGPNSTPEKATLIGEAAHIYGARKNAKRFNPEMSDNTRAQVTNGIWLCSNCHTLIDSDQFNYPSELLFRWRENHEKSIINEIGTASDQIRFKIEQTAVEKYSNFPSHLKRIIIDKPIGWEWQLSAEMIRYLCFPSFKKIKALREGKYTRPLVRIPEQKIISWLNMVAADLEQIFKPVSKILEEFNAAWGKPGDAGDVDDIHEACSLLNDHLEQVLILEERIKFVHVDNEYHNIFNLFRDLAASQSEKIANMTNDLDEMVALANTDHGGTDERPLLIKKTIDIVLPDGWEEEVHRELERIKAMLNRRQVISD